ncbi:uncharacterized protein Z518_03523 [Rhinocladiella mackenziei CBS 650.93]|uniref:Rhinocladiella mackenziei CBS 650.93 unplaced genomic scaffold supercont1.2, whole genome shotgun sequence n=1 Tax=Rhinocladiella mackenziei CBS 650.93 TaxID=1442369 RepID=A0A0D2IZM6_9EURO|nr:uncharacterized protein Z518_03523 [Rhinocladiella mackenziei CBS 650.93]KIX08866.1 hypothetical protein Z518_03523 [Rhinocladiella mackenziei CBS 650.93]
MIPPGIAFVTGGGRGLGNAVACSFARAGCRGIVIIDILPDAELEKGRQAVAQLGAKRGTIVNFASVNSILGGLGTAAYTASKHAVNGLTKTAALEYRKQHIRINAISPGFIWTAIAAENTKNDPRAQEVWAQMESRQGRTAYPEEIGDASVLL